MIIKYSAQSFICEGVDVSGNRKKRPTSARTGGEFNIIDGHMAAILRSRQIGYGFKNESVRIGRAVGHMTLYPEAASRVGRQPDFVDDFLPSRLVHEDRLKWSPRRSENTIRSSSLPLMPLPSWHKNTVDDKRSCCVVGCGAVTFKRDHLDAQ